MWNTGASTSDSLIYRQFWATEESNYARKEYLEQFYQETSPRRLGVDSIVLYSVLLRIRRRNNQNERVHFRDSYGQGTARSHPQAGLYGKHKP